MLFSTTHTLGNSHVIFMTQYYCPLSCSAPSSEIPQQRILCIPCIKDAYKTYDIKIRSPTLVLSSLSLSPFFFFMVFVEVQVFIFFMKSNLLENLSLRNLPELFHPLEVKAQLYKFFETEGSTLNDSLHNPYLQVQSSGSS